MKIGLAMLGAGLGVFLGSIIGIKIIEYLDKKDQEKFDKKMRVIQNEIKQERLKETQQRSYE